MLSENFIFMTHKIELPFMRKMYNFKTVNLTGTFTDKLCAKSGHMVSAHSVHQILSVRRGVFPDPLFL